MGPNFFLSEYHMPYILIRVTGTPTHPDDKEVPGDFIVYVDEGASASDTYNLALNCFHEHWGIAMLEDFDITAYNANLAPLEIPADDKINDQTKTAKFLGPANTTNIVT